MRGYENYRFRDLDAMVLSFEYRYPIWDIGVRNGSVLDFVLFYDAGLVSHAIEDELSADKLLTGYGFGLRARKTLGTIIRLNLSRSSEDIRIDIKFGKDF